MRGRLRSHGHPPLRRCVGCGRTAPKDELLRLALAPARGEQEHASRAVAVLDAQGRMPGRGAYLCRQPGGALPAAECLATALRRRAIPRALRAAAAVDAKLVESVSR